MTVVPATQQERDSIFGGDEGFLAIEDGIVVGYCAFNERAGGFYAHTCHCVAGFAQIVQRLRDEAAKRGHERGYFHVVPDTEFLKRYLSRWIESGRARVVGESSGGVMVSVESRRKK